MKVPDPDGQRGSCGACFPKDTNALLHFLKYNKPIYYLEGGSRKHNERIQDEHFNYRPMKVL